MTRKNLSQTTAITAIFLLLAISSMAQDSCLKNRRNIKLSGTPQLTIGSQRHRAFLMSEINYGIHNHIEVGIALGFENTIVPKLKPGASHSSNLSDYYPEDYISPLYNFHMNYHLMPYLFKERDSRFDVYLAGKLGGAYLESDFTDQNFFWNYYLGGGLSWYFTRYIGVYTEYGKQWPFRGESRNKPQFRFGVTAKF